MLNAATRLQHLRALLKEEGVDGFLLPRGDEYLGEYVPACAERLAWLTDFTGSAGFAIVLPQTACVFSDGRYQLQMSTEVDLSVWSLAHMYEISGPSWLMQNGRGLKIGYDPRTISEDEISGYLRAGCIMQGLNSNPVDKIWQDQPVPPNSIAELLPATVTGDTPHTRIASVAASLQHDGQDAIILSDPTSIAWMLCIRGHDLPFLPVVRCFAITSASSDVQLFIDADRIPAEISGKLGKTIHILPPSSLEDALLALRNKTVRLDPARSSAWFWQTLRTAEANPVAGTDPCLRLRACKTEAERTGMKQAHLLDGIALCRFLFWLEQNGIGRTEIEIAQKLLDFRLDNAECKGPSFETIAAAGPNAAIMHYAPRPESCATLKADSFFLLDSGGQYHSGTTDVTRTIWLGDSLPGPVLRDQYTRVLKGLIALSRAVFPKETPGYRLDPLARFALWQVDLDFDHGAGHGLGSYLSVHEWPLGFTRRPVLDPIEEHMVLTNEPGYYANGSHGIRLENAMQVHRHNETGSFLCFDTLTRAPIDHRGIEISLLLQEERDWIDHFHASVLTEISPHLNAEEKEWLRKACAPL